MKKKFIAALAFCALTASAVAGAAGCKPTLSGLHTHSYTESVVAPTCTEKGYTLHKCGCGDEYKDNEVPANGHTEVDVKGTPATCTNDGLSDGKRCSVCGTDTAPQQKIKAGHKFMNGKCSVCGEPDPDFKFTEELTYSEIKDGNTLVAYAVSGITDDTVANVAIPAEHEGLPVTKIGAKAFYNNQAIKSVTVPDSIEEIETQAFYWCANLQSLNLGKGLKKVGNYFLGGCFALESIEIAPENSILKSENNCIIDRETTTVIGGCKTGVIPDTAKAIGDYAFAYCAVPENVSFPESVEIIGKSAFENSYYLKSVSIPSSVNTVKGSAFRNCAYLNRVDVNSATVEMFAFSNCRKLYSMTVGKNVTSMKSSAVTECLRLVDICNKSDLPLVTKTAYNSYSMDYARNIYGDESKKGEFTDVNGYKFYAYTDTDGNDGFYLIDYNGEQTQLTLPSPSDVKFTGKTVENYKINWNALRGLTEVTSIIIPDGVTEIGESAVQAATALESVVIGNSVKKILNNAFWGATKLAELTVPENVGYVELNAFKGLTALTTVRWNSVECTTNVDLSQNSITNITAQNRIFYGCDKLKNVIFGESVKRIPEALFRGCTAITSVTIPASVNTIGAAAFYGCSNLESVIFADKTSDWTTAFNAEGTGSTSNPPKTVTSQQLSSSTTAAQMLAALNDYKYAGYGTNYWLKNT